MARETVKKHQDSTQSASETRAEGKEATSPSVRPDDIVDEATINRLELIARRLEAIAGGADEDDPRIVVDSEIEPEVAKLNASVEEEIDALRVDLVQDGGESRTEDTSGRIVDDVAEEQLARFTETGPMQSDQGVADVAPGHEDTSRRLRRHHPRTGLRGQNIVEGNIEQPSDEEIGDRKVDEGTAA